MADDNIFKFGYGDIIVNYGFNDLKLSHIDIPQTIGNQYDPSKFNILSERRIIFNSISEIDTVISKFKDILIDKGYYQFEYDGVIFDFTNWNEKSIQICIDAMGRIRHWFMVPLAA